VKIFVTSLWQHRLTATLNRPSTKFAADHEILFYYKKLGRIAY